MNTNGNNRSALTAPLRTSSARQHATAYGGLFGAMPGMWDRGRFQRSMIESMLRDPRVRFVLAVKAAPVYAAKLEVESPDPRIAAFVGKQMRKLWDVHLPLALRQLLAHGHLGGEVNSKDQDGLLEIGGLACGTLPDWRPVLEAGEVVGVNAHNQADAHGPVKIRHPGRWFWLSHGGADVWGWPVPEGMWRPWHEKTSAKGYLDSRRLYAFRHAFGGDTLYHPEGTILVGTKQVPVADFIDDLLAKCENGATLGLPSTTDKNGNRLWERIRGEPGANPDFLMNLGEKLDREYFEGAEIPIEVVEAADTGSGWAGRTVPFLVYLGMADQIVGAIARGWDSCLVRPLVDQNFGAGAKYEVKPKSLIPSGEEDDGKPKGKSQGNVSAEPPDGTMPTQPPGQKQAPPAMLSADAGVDLGDPDERASLIAEILAGVFGDDAGAAFDDTPGDSTVQLAADTGKRSWDKLLHPRGAGGRFIPKGSPEAVATAHDKVKEALKGDKTPASVRTLADHLSILTVKQLHELKRSHNLSASAPTVAALRDKIADRLDRGRREGPPAKKEPTTPEELQALPVADVLARVAEPETTETISVQHAKGYSGKLGGRSWVAQIGGTDSTYGLKRDFLDADKTDWHDKFNKPKKTWTNHHTVPKTGGIYEVNEHGEKAVAIYFPATHEGKPSLVNATVGGEELAGILKDYEDAGLDAGALVKAMSWGRAVGLKGVKVRADAYRAKVNPPEEDEGPVAPDAPDDPGRPPERTPPPVQFVPHPKSGPDEEMVMVDPQKFDAAWSKDTSYHLPAGKQGVSEIKGRREAFEKFLTTGKPVEAPRVVYGPNDPTDSPSIDDGRHRFAVLRDAGVKAVAVMVPKDRAEEFRRKFAPGERAKPAALSADVPHVIDESDLLEA